MPATGRSAVGRVMVGMGRQPGAAATTRLQALLDQINTNANARDVAVLGALRDRARTALTETAALAASVPTLKTVHDALQAALQALERRIAVVSGQGPQISGHRAAPPANPLRDPPPANGYSVPDEDAPRAQGYGRVEPVAEVPPPEANPLRDAPASASGYGRVVPVVDPSAPIAYTLTDEDAPRAQGYGRLEPVAEAPPVPNPLREEPASISINYAVPDTEPRAQDEARGAPTGQLPVTDMYTLDDDDDDEAAAEEPVADASVQAYGRRGPDNPAPVVPPPAPQPPADGFERRAAVHAERRAALHAAETPEDTTKRAAAISEHLARELKKNGDLLSAEQRRAFGDEYRRARALGDPSAQAEAFDALRREVDATIGARLQEISALMSDLTRLEPLVTRALALLAGDAAQREAHGALATNWQTLQSTLATPGGDPQQARRELDTFEAEVRQTLQGISLDTKRAAQAARLRPSPDAPLALGNELGVGNFGRVVELGADANGTGLVGKTRKPGGDDARFRQDIEQEEKIYAQVGEHPNIARCFGIQRIGNEDVLVMEKIEGPKMNEVFTKLEDRYREGEINREQYLGALQQLIKGTLQGLAQFEAMGMTHRDIKDDNIMFDEATMQPKLVDMGLAQAHGQRENPMLMVLSAPPEVNAGSKAVDDKWDTYTVAKMLFPRTELDPIKHDPNRADQTAEHYQFVPGRQGAQIATPAQGAWLPEYMSAHDVLDASKQAMIKNPDGSFSARVGQDGEYVDQPLHPAPGNARSASPGEFALDSAYVDFMNRLGHPDPAQRMTAAEALKHPFMTQQLGDPDKLKKALAQPASAQAQARAQAPADGGDIQVNYENGEDIQVNYQEDEDRPVMYRNE